MALTRREFIRRAAVGTAALVGTAAIGRYTPFRLGGEPMTRRLAITEALVQMVDRSLVYHWAFEDLDDGTGLPRMPGPLLQATTGEEVRLSITNTLPNEHGFQIPGVPGEPGNGIVIEPGETRTLIFPAPTGGSYMYFDHLEPSVNRVLGLHGPMIVLPNEGITPYSAPTPAVQQLFDDLGDHVRFPGDSWLPERTRVWLFNSIDPRFNEMASRGESINNSVFFDEFLPRYFTINGLSGAYASHSPSVVPTGRIGHPHVIRLMNAGMAWNSPHLHANHFYVLARLGPDSRTQMVMENVIFVDTITVKPLQRIDWLIPFIRPQDIPGDPSIPLRVLIPEELSMTLGHVSQSPLSYPMHCHMEMSQTAAGGNYPQGLVTHWEITGDVDGVDFPGSNPQDMGGINQELHSGEGR